MPEWLMRARNFLALVPLLGLVSGLPSCKKPMQ